MTPHFTHDCDRCKYHGHMQGHDVYTCVSSIVLRFGHDGPEYQSLSKEMLDRVAMNSGLWSAAKEFIEFP